MKNYFNTILLVSVFFALFSCIETQKEYSTQQLIKEIDEEKTDSLQQADQITFWKNRLTQEKYASDRVASARINYKIAKSFAPLNIDSAEVYTTKALILIENVEGFEKEKTAIYNGLGVVANHKGKFFLASFYTNKAVSILDANPSISTIPIKEKVRYYLYNAGHSAHIGLYESAYEMSKKAEKYVDFLPKVDNLRWRIYRELFASNFYYRKNTSIDSLRHYLEKMEQNSYSDEHYRLNFETKALIFRRNNQFDSARIYFQKLLKINHDETTSLYTTNQNICIDHCNLLQNSIDRGKIKEADSIMIKVGELEKEFSSYLDLGYYLNFNRIMMDYYYLVRNFDKYQQTAEKVLEMHDEQQQKAELQAKQEMQTMYELEEKKKSINKLNQSVEVTENQLQKTKYFLAITILAILVILAILTILYYRQKSRKLQQEYEKVVLEQKLLRTQMEPHFIFNTLSTLQSLIRFQEPKKAIDYLNLFSKLLRSNLELSRQDTVSLGDEIESLHNYLKLQQARFKDYFTYQIQIPSELEIDALCIPPMLIQPFVENSILHGFEGEKEWNIEIKITELAETKQLQIEIIDNGIGINSTIKKTKKSISGDIAKERLEIVAKKYKIPTDYQIFSEKGKGTRVCLKLPIINGFQ